MLLSTLLNGIGALALSVLFVYLMRRSSVAARHMSEILARLERQYEVIKVTPLVRQSALSKWQGARGLIERWKKVKAEDKAEEYLWWHHRGSQRCSFCEAVMGACPRCPLFSGQKCHKAWDQIAEAAEHHDPNFVEVFEKQVPIMYEVIQQVETTGGG